MQSDKVTVDAALIPDDQDISHCKSATALVAVCSKTQKQNIMI
jgi:hypothetical protein